MDDLHKFLRSNSSNDLFSWEQHLVAKERFGMTHAEVELSALALGLLPTRYQRNRDTIDVADQLKLCRSTVAVIGCGGLGGYVIEQLARLGVGTIVAFDPDVFEEHNLNRQLLSSPEAVGQTKVSSAAERVAEINPAVKLIARHVAYSRQNQALLGGCDVVVDALDSIRTRFDLAASCRELGITLVHGAIAGWYGQVTTQFPGERTIEALYSRWVEGRGAEKQLGNPSFTPALVASIEAAEVCKVLLGKGTSLRGRKISINLLDMSFDELVIEDARGSEA